MTVSRKRYTKVLQPTPSPHCERTGREGVTRLKALHLMKVLQVAA